MRRGYTLSSKCNGENGYLIGKQFFVSTLAHTQTSNLQVINTKIIELLEENLQEYLCDLEVERLFFFK